MAFLSPVLLFYGDLLNKSNNWSSYNSRWRPSFSAQYLGICCLSQLFSSCIWFYELCTDDTHLYKHIHMKKRKIYDWPMHHGFEVQAYITYKLHLHLNILVISLKNNWIHFLKKLIFKTRLNCGDNWMTKLLHLTNFCNLKFVLLYQKLVHLLKLFNFPS